MFRVNGVCQRLHPALTLSILPTVAGQRLTFRYAQVVPLPKLYDLEKTRDEIEAKVEREVTPLVQDKLDFAPA